MALPTVSSASIATSNLIVVLLLLYLTETYWLLMSCSTICTSRMQVFQVVCKVKLFIWPCTICLLSLPVAKMFSLSFWSKNCFSLCCFASPLLTNPTEFLCFALPRNKWAQYRKDGEKKEEKGLKDWIQPQWETIQSQCEDSLSVKEWTPCRFCSTCIDKKRNKKETSELNTTTCRACLTSNSCCEHLNKLIGSTCDRATEHMFCSL